MLTLCQMTGGLCWSSLWSLLGFRARRPWHRHIRQPKQRSARFSSAVGPGIKVEMALLRLDTCGNSTMSREPLDPAVGSYRAEQKARRSLFYPKQGKNDFYQKLLKQCRNLKIAEISPDTFDDALGQTDIVMDAIFGFSFKGEPRAPFDRVIESLKKTDKPIVSVDIPSAWDVEEGDPENKYFTPSVLVSLTAPKLGSRGFKGKHYLGGRFLPPQVIRRRPRFRCS